MIDYSGFLYGKGVPRAAAKLVRERTESAAEKACYAAVDKRDGRKCAFPGCKRPMAHHHHLRYRSRGGMDTPSNVLSLCPRHHSWIHGGLVRVEGSAPRVRWVLTESGRAAKIRIGD